MVDPRARDLFDRARTWAVALMLVAGVAAVAGSALDWVTITARPELRPDATFEGASNQPEEPRATQPFTGLEAGDGWWSLAGGVGLALGAGLLLVRKRAGGAWFGTVASMVIGAVAIADYRGIGDLSSSISHRMDIVGRAEPGVGLVLVVAGALAGLIGSVAGIAASPNRSAIRTSA
jgi:LPXTG-motif cell wall-anchored protein